MAEKWEFAGGLFKGSQVRGKDKARDALRRACHAQRALPDARGMQHRAEDARGRGADQAGALEAWQLFKGGVGTETGLPAVDERIKENIGVGLTRDP